MNPLTQSKNTTILPVLIALTLACFGLSPAARAVCREGCDPINLNTFLGNDVLVNNTTGSNNTAIGFQALNQNTTGGGNTAIGSNALSSNTTGTSNTANGDRALVDNTTGIDNTAMGSAALFSNTTGRANTATGPSALRDNTTGAENTAIGSNALSNNTTGSHNTATGYFALFDNTTGHSNIALGDNAGISLIRGNFNIYIGNIGARSESGTIRIGTVGTHNDTIIAGISGGTVPDGVGVIVGSNGKLGTVVSSERFKDEIKPMDKASEAILALRPVSFHYKHELDPEGIPQFGLVAEDVEKVNPDLVARDEQGKPYTVRYEVVNVMLLNEFIKARRQIDSQQKEIEALTAGLQKVSAQLELSRHTPETALNN
jgi:hypothetical protein